MPPDPDFRFDCERCGQPYEVRLGCIDRALERAAVLASPKRCPDCEGERVRALIRARAP